MDRHDLDTSTQRWDSMRLVIHWQLESEELEKPTGASVAQRIILTIGYKKCLSMYRLYQGALN